jgi:thiamine-phosphate pyrophosphorylase
MIADSRLYFVCEAQPHGVDPTALLRAAIAGGVDAIQLREKEGAGDQAIIAAAESFRRAASAAGIPFLVNDRPDLVGACRADGVHVGQDDVSVGRARELAGDEAIVGLSTHSAEQLEAAITASGADRPDYVSVGPVWETPTKAGRPATGLDYVRLAARDCPIPWFAIGGIDTTNIREVSDAGARRVVVVRAIRDAPDPGAAARALRTALDSG